MLNFRVCRCLGNNQIVILDMDEFKEVEAAYSKTQILACEYKNEYGETETATIWNGNIDEAATHVLLHEADADPILSAFLRGRVPSPNWSFDDSIICIVDEYEFTLMAEDPDQVVAWVETAEQTAVHLAHKMRIQKQENHTRHAHNP